MDSKRKTVEDETLEELQRENSNSDLNHRDCEEDDNDIMPADGNIVYGLMLHNNSTPEEDLDGKIASVMEEYLIIVSTY